MDIFLKEVDAQDKDLHGLIAKLDDELAEMYPQQGIFGVDFNDAYVKHMVFVVATMDQRPVGCGAVRPYDEESIELKRFFVDKSMRGKGIASKILRYLEEVCKTQGYRRIVLETGPKQPEAIALYKKFGYQEIELFGEYLESNSEHSLCFEKKINA